MTARFADVTYWGKVLEVVTFSEMGKPRRLSSFAFGDSSVSHTIIVGTL